MMLKQATSFRRRLIVTDTLFSMDGDLAPLEQVTDLAERYDAMVVVDEAHATGVFGVHGRGVAEQLGVEDRIQARVGTLSKALGSMGGFVAGSNRLIEWLANKSRSYVFSTTIPAAAAAAGLKALEIVRAEPERRSGLLSRAAEVREQLRRQGWNTGESASQIIPLYIGEPSETMRLATAVRERGIFVPGIRPPTVAEGESLLRISVTWSHSADMLEALFAALTEVMAG
jgi:8-amino-7-oxononanoate synthase